ncbi:unnamed protein product [Prorocentrum cordatum]|uniref:Ion transport domain-containing protein n=1 Tax=Prorocentrum cordatum TaxID=2364126 RepID=A0ABN9VVT7_9DINO|nr:unnamed protein product [Polarella glacialis]
MSKERTLSEERERHLSKFAERQGQTEAVELGTATVWIERLNGLWKLKEPRRSGRLAMLFQNSWFEVFVQVIIMVNCIFMALAANSEMTNWDEDQNPLILPLEIVFQVIYTVELVAKLYVHGWYFFWNEDWALNMLDFTLVFTGALDIVLRLGKLWNVTYMRSLRVVKVAKALRLVRVITGAVQLRNIFICIIGSLMNFIWSIVMIAVVLYMFSLGMVISAATHLQEMGEGTTDSDEKVRVELLSMYGSVQQSMLTLYKATTGGDDWSLSFNAISNTGWVASAVYLIFVSFMHIPGNRIITGIFVDTALERLAPDREAMALSRRKEDEMVALELRKLWREVGEDDEFISAADFHRGLRDDRIPAWFQHVGLSLDNVIQFFGVLWRSSENGKVRINNFVHGCMRLKGSASSFDIQELRSEVSTISRKVDRLGLT